MSNLDKTIKLEKEKQNWEQTPKYNCRKTASPLKKLLHISESPYYLSKHSLILGDISKEIKLWHAWAHRKMTYSQWEVWGGVSSSAKIYLTHTCLGPDPKLLKQRANLSAVFNWLCIQHSLTLGEREKKYFCFLICGQIVYTFFLLLLSLGNSCHWLP